MTAATFEAATLVDAVKNAATYAPTRGAGVDRAPGVNMVVDPEAMRATLRATDLFVFYRQEIPVSWADATEPFTWRMPSQPATAIIAGLPMGLGAAVTLTENEDGFLYVTCGRSRGRLKLISRDAGFPAWPDVPLDDLLLIENLPQRVQQVRWAAASDKVGGILTGLHLDGKHLYATDGNIAARVPLEAPVPGPITAPLHHLGKAMQSYPEVYLGAAENRLCLNTDVDIQLQTFLLEGPYPQVDQLVDFPLAHEIAIDRDITARVLTRVQAIVDDKRFPLVQVELLAEGLVRLTMDVEDVGTIVEDIPTESTVEPITFHASPDVLASMVKACQSNLVHFAYESTKKPYRIRDGVGFVGVAMPRRAW